MIIAGVAVGLLLAGGMISMLWNDRNSRLEAAQRQSAALASGSSRLLRAQLVTWERALRGTASDTREFYRQVPDQAPALFEASLRGVLERNQDLASITLVDDRGVPLSAGVGDLTLQSWVVPENRLLNGGLYLGALEPTSDKHWMLRAVVSGLDLGRDGTASIGNRYGQLLAHSRDPERLIGSPLAKPMRVLPP
ncbi:MAG: sensor domain-containing phosphodiesterase, partial [Stenotrophomonas sp.]